MRHAIFLRCQLAALFLSPLLMLICFRHCDYAIELAITPLMLSLILRFHY